MHAVVLVDQSDIIMHAVVLVDQSNNSTIVCYELSLAQHHVRGHTIYDAQLYCKVQTMCGVCNPLFMAS